MNKLCARHWGLFSSKFFFCLLTILQVHSISRKMGAMYADSTTIITTRENKITKVHERRREHIKNKSQIHSRNELWLKFFFWISSSFLLVPFMRLPYQPDINKRKMLYWIFMKRGRRTCSYLYLKTDFATFLPFHSFLSWGSSQHAYQLSSVCSMLISLRNWIKICTPMLIFIDRRELVIVSLFVSSSLSCSLMWRFVFSVSDDNI